MILRGARQLTTTTATTTTTTTTTESIPCPELIFWIYYTERLRSTVHDVPDSRAHEYHILVDPRPTTPNGLLTRAKTKVTM